VVCVIIECNTVHRAVTLGNVQREPSFRIGNTAAHGPNYLQP